MLSNRLSQVPKLELQQKITQQQILRAELLQVPLLELVQRVELELNQNPLLELADPDENLHEEVQWDDNEVGLPDVPATDTALEKPSSIVESIEETNAPEFAREEQSLTDLSNDVKSSEIDWESVFGGDVNSEFGLPAFSDNSEDETDRQEQFHSEINFLDSIREQLTMDVRLSEFDREIGEQLIGALKPSGYLDNDVVHFLSNKLEVEPVDVERVLKCLQSYDPPGIFARSLHESLTIQLRRKKEDLLPQNPRRVIVSQAIQLLDEHFELIARRRFEQIRQITGWSEEELKAVFAMIQSLQPIPGVGTEEQEFITPDIWVTLQPRDSAPPNRIVELDSGRVFYLYLNDATVPDLRISRKYREMFLERNLDTDTKQWLAQKFEAARNFVKAIQSRHKTILDVMEWIIRYQYRFFSNGETLIPLTQIQVADRAGCDNSTVSRAIKDKYVETEWGIFPLKHFFSGGLESDFGGDVSTREIKQKLSELIENENKHEPLTDQSLCDALNEMGYHLARRTVQKYREQLGYPLARFRRTL